MRTFLPPNFSPQLQLHCNITRIPATLISFSCIISSFYQEMEKSESTKINIPETSRERKGKAPLLGAPAAHSTGGYNRGVAVFDLILRIAAAVAALAATIAMGTTEQTLPFFTQFFQFKASYDDLPTFTFFVIAMAIICGYLILSIPFSVVCIIRPHATAPRLLLFVLDTVAATLGTAASGASAAIVYLAHQGNRDANWLAICQQFNDFCQRTSGSVIAGFTTVVLLVLLILLSAFARRR